MVSKEVLAETLANVRKQKDEHFAIYHQAVGAIGVLEHLMAQKDHLTTEEFGKMVGGTVEEIVPNE